MYILIQYNRVQEYNSLEVYGSLKIEVLFVYTRLYGWLAHKVTIYNAMHGNK